MGLCILLVQQTILPETAAIPIVREISGVS
jgi:hypothetical protein